ncbi:uncharacterized protein LOC124125562 [Haliotis rufescens]|uniref:uncharacterized protein LOC124125562 n=1 Tax=Haliotis rufescens TaxID=6454 RepID=UPI00201F404D|nr:uncharacterized protein LOC124125562 [Haliotis rufescens]
MKGLSSCLPMCLCLAVCLQIICGEDTQQVDTPLSRQKRFDFDFDKILKGLKTAGTFVKTATNLLGQGNSTFGRFINRLPFLDLPDAKSILGRFDDMMKKEAMTPVQMDLAHQLMDALNHTISLKEQFEESSGQKQFDLVSLLAGLRTAGTVTKTITNVLGFRNSAFGRFVNQVPFLDVPDAKNVLEHVENMMKTEKMSEVKMDHAHQLMEALEYSIQMKEQLGEGSGSSTLLQTSTLMMLPVMCAVKFTI